MNDYLFDRSGETLPDVAELETLLAPHRFQPRALPVRGTRSVRRWLLAALVLIAVGALASPHLQSPVPVWTVDDASGCTGDCTLAVGIPLEAGDPLRLTAPGIGEMDLAGGTTLRLLASGRHEQRLALDVGSIDVRVTTPPRVFVVDTPAATAVDLGCAYSLTVDERGDSRLAVRMGFVSLETPAGAVLIPQGFEAIARKGAGLGTPFRTEANLGTPYRDELSLSALIARIDLDRDPAALDGLTESAVAEDALTLLYASTRIEGPAHARAIDRLLALAPQLDRQAIESGNTTAAAASLTGYR